MFYFCGHCNKFVWAFYDTNSTSVGKIWLLMHTTQTTRNRKNLKNEKWKIGLLYKKIAKMCFINEYTISPPRQELFLNAMMWYLGNFIEIPRLSVFVKYDHETSRKTLQSTKLISRFSFTQIIKMDKVFIVPIFVYHPVN